MQTLPKLRRAFLALMDAAIQEPRWLPEMTLPPRFYLILMAALFDGLNNTGPSRETDQAHGPCLIDPSHGPHPILLAARPPRPFSWAPGR